MNCELHLKEIFVYFFYSIKTSKQYLLTLSVKKTPKAPKVKQ